MNRRATAVLMRGRRRAERLMILRCTIRRVTGETTDRNTGKVVETAELVYPNADHPVGRCKITSYEGHEQERDVAGWSATQQRLAIHLPVGAYDVRVGDIIEITESPLDPRLVGRKYRTAQEAPYRTFATADRVFIDSHAK